jgi:hypothetical protein
VTFDVEEGGCQKGKKHGNLTHIRGDARGVTGNNLQLLLSKFSNPHLKVTSKSFMQAPPRARFFDQLLFLADSASLLTSVYVVLKVNTHTHTHTDEDKK